MSEREKSYRASIFKSYQRQGEPQAFTVNIYSEYPRQAVDFNDALSVECFKMESMLSMHPVESKEDFPTRDLARWWGDARIAEKLAEDELRADGDDDSADLCKGLMTNRVMIEVMGTRIKTLGDDVARVSAKVSRIFPWL